MKLGLSAAALAEQERVPQGESPPPDCALRPGHLLDGRFAITGQLNRGGMSTIYQAEDLQNDHHLVALKVPLMTLGMDPKQMPRFDRENEIGRRVDHPAVMKFIPVHGTKSRPYLAMEFLDGITLYHVLKERERLPETEALKLAADICGALEYLHGQGIVHRDLKPENIMLCRDGSMRLMDFGIARSDESPRLTFVGFVPGTPHYMAPERVKCKRGDARTDIYGVGAMLYEMLTGVIAFDHEDPMVIMNARACGDPEAPRRLDPAITPQAEEIVLRAMERDPARRYPTAAAMQADLLAPSQVKLTGRHTHLQPATKSRRFWRKARLLAPWIVIPLALQVLGFFLLLHFSGKK